MSKYGEKVAESAVKQAFTDIRRIYQQAVKELKAKLNDFTLKYAAADAEKRALLEQGKITEGEYRDWLLGQVFTGKRWQEKVNQAARMLVSANEQAAEVVNHGRLNVFAENYNFAAYETEKQFGNMVQFNIFNTSGVARLIKEKPQMLPVWKPDEKKDYIWNRDKVQNAITQGIIQGEGIDKITDRMVAALQTQNQNKMRTFARTAMTGAQNAGVQRQIEDAEEQGIEQKRMWKATLDEVTREAHAELDGQQVGVDEPFRVGDEEIMYPGDPSASPHMTYNCRCALERVYVGINRKRIRRAYDEPDETGHRDSYLVENMTYKEWKEWKERGKQ